jgi:hypothetical protein
VIEQDAVWPQLVAAVGAMVQGWLACRLDCDVYRHIVAVMLAFVAEVRNLARRW